MKIERASTSLPCQTPFDHMKYAHSVGGVGWKDFTQGKYLYGVLFFFDIFFVDD